MVQSTDEFLFDDGILNTTQQLSESGGMTKMEKIDITNQPQITNTRRGEGRLAPILLCSVDTGLKNISI